MTSLDDVRPNERRSVAVRRTARLWLPSLGLRRSERQLLLLGMDLLLVNLALMISLHLRTELLDPNWAILLNLKWFVTLTVVWCAVAVIPDAYDLARAANATHSVATVIVAAVVAGFLFQAIPWFAPPIISRTQVFLFPVFAVIFLAAWRALYATVFVQPSFQRRTLLVGAGLSGRHLLQTIRRHAREGDANPFSGTGHILLGFVDDDPDLTASSIHGVPVLGDSSRLVTLVQELAVDEVIVAITYAHQIRPALFEAILDCREMGLPVSTMNTVYERLTGRVPVDHVSRNIEIAAGVRETVWMRFFAAAKRMVDVFGACAGLVVLVGVMPAVALGNVLWSPGALFYRQVRVGRGGKSFTLTKFRSMIVGAEDAHGAVWAQRDDPRVTPFGAWLRRTHIDELPQMVNILRGEMSLIGPRPERPEFVSQLSRSLPFYRARNSVRPGLTGWAQIHQNYGDSLEGAQEKLEYDLYYVKYANPLLEMLILLRTVAKVLGLRGR